MTKKEYCLKNPPVAYYSGFSRLEIHGIEFGADDFLYCVSGAWGAKSCQKYHRLKIKYDQNGGAFVRLHGYKVPLNECIRMGGLIMGTVNYCTSDYITLGYNCNIEYVFDDYWEDETEQRNFQISFLHDEIKDELEKQSFYYFHITIKPGYYEGFTLDIENNFPVAFDSWEDRRDANKEITQIKQFLIDCAGFGLVECSPGWCTGYSDYSGTIEAIKQAVKEMRDELKKIPT